MSSNPPASSVESKKPRLFYGYIVVIAGFIVMAMMWGPIFSFGVFLKPVSADFGWTRAMTTGAYSLYMVLHGSLYIITGRITDRFGPRILVTVCGSLFGLGFLLMSQISDLWQLYLFYGVFVAIGISGSWVPILSIVARWFVKKRGLMSGIVSSGMGVGIMIGPPVTSWLISRYGWSTSFMVIGIIALVLIIPAAQFLKRDPSQVGMLPDAESEATEESITREAKGFSLYEAMHSKRLWLTCAAYFCSGGLVHAGMVHTVPHATDLGISAIVAANLLVVIGALSIVGRIGMGRASDKIGNILALAVVFVLWMAGFLWLLPAEEAWMLYLFAIAFGFAFGGENAVMSPLVAELFGMKSHGLIFGLVSFIATVGGAIWPLFAAHIFDTTGSYQLGFLVFAGISLVGLMLILTLRRTSRLPVSDA
ncbi:MFS transporter [Chloroflexota bacterium]